MKKRLARLIFKKELAEAYNKLNNSYHIEVQKVENAMGMNKKTYGLVKRIFSLYSEAEIVGIEKNKNYEELIVVIHNEAIYLFGERYQGIMGLPRIYFEIRSQEIGSPNKYIHISDVLMKDNDIGNGTIAMNALIKYAKKNMVKWIEGGLSSVDDNHADRRNHFYEKFGFIIQDSSIRLDLTSEF